MARKRVVIAACAAALFVLWQLHVSSKSGAFFGDFRAFYCAGAALAHGADPYAANSLYACERAPMPFGLYHALTGVAVPAPLPGYALLAFVPFGVLPFLPACAVFLMVLLATSAASVKALALLIGRPWDASLWALATGLAVIVIPFGELGSIIMAAILWMAVALRRKAWTLAAACGAFAMILPHIGLPALLATFLFVRPMRVRLAVVAAVLIAMDAIAGGPHTAIAYVLTVLPAHAAAEIGSTAQYGFTWMLHGLGASDRAAIVGGELSYAIMLVLGVLAALKISVRTGDAAHCALVAPAFAVFGGTFMHYTQIMVAIPAALLLWAHARNTGKSVFAAAALLLAFPWAWVLGQPVLIVAYAVVLALMVRAVFEWDAAAALRVAFGGVLLCAVILIAGYHFGAGLSTHVHGVAAHQGLAQSSWGEFIRSQRASTGPAWWIAKAPTWIGLALLTLGCAYVLTKKDLVPPVAIKQVPVMP